MAGNVGEIRVRGIAELNRSFNRIDKKLGLRLKAILAEVGEPVRRTAERMAVERISHLQDGKWAEMRVGVTAKTVYIAPKQRGSKMGPQKRPTFGPLLLEEALIPALELQAPATFAAMEAAIDQIIEGDFA